MVDRLVRRSVRVVCVDGDGRVLLLHWRDPHSGELLWEPPGGGVEPGESDLDAANREWQEETGLGDVSIEAQPLLVHRDETWAGTHVVGDEPIHLARHPGSAPALSRSGLVEEEPDNLVGSLWVNPAELAALPDRVTPDVAGVLARFGVPGWA